MGTLMINFGDFIVDSSCLDRFRVVKSGAMDICISLFPYGVAEKPELEDQVGGQMCRRVAIM